MESMYTLKATVKVASFISFQNLNYAIENEVIIQVI